jgi:hypothetical protein
MPEITHVSDNDLIRFADGEVDGTAALAIKVHIQDCPHCRSRFEQLKTAAEAYTAYHAQALKPSLASSGEWPRLRFVAEHRGKPNVATLLWRFMIPAFICALAIVAVVLYSNAPQRRVTQILAHAAASPSSPHRRLQVTFNGKNLYRPAVLRPEGADQAALEPTKALFVRANYSWDDPLSARSFAAWRKQLHNKHDELVSMNSNDGRSRFYRVRTDTSDGILRVASLTLRADTLRPVDGRFHFENLEEVTIADVGEMSAEPPVHQLKEPATPQSPPVENRVSAEDELRVFTALDAIGADAGEPVNVEIDPSQRHIVVSGIGLLPDREREIRQALAALPNVTTRFNAAGQSPAPIRRTVPDTYSNDAAPLRHELESKAGGAQAFQDLADRALDSSSSLIAQAHALGVLAQTFPPAVESGFDTAEQATLSSLRRHHAVLIETAAAQLRNGLGPLLNLPQQQTSSPETRMMAQTSWQAEAEQLLKEAKLVDTSLARLVGGTYSQQAGEDMLAQLPDQIRNVENLARAEGTR